MDTSTGSGYGERGRPVGGQDRDGYTVKRNVDGNNSNGTGANSGGRSPAVIGVSLVAAVLTVLLGVDPATAAPAVGQIVAVEAAADAEVDALEAREENFEATVPNPQAAVPAADLTAPAWEPSPGPSEDPEVPLPEASAPPVGDAPPAEGSAEPVEDVPAEAQTQTPSGGQSEFLSGSSAAELEGAQADGSETAGPGAAMDGMVVDLADGATQVATGGATVTVKPARGQEKHGLVEVAAEDIGPGQDLGSDAPGVLVTLAPTEATSPGETDSQDKRAAGSPPSHEGRDEQDIAPSEEDEPTVPAADAVSVEVDYAELADRGEVPGGDWAARLTLLDSSGVPLEGVVNDADAQTVSAPVDLSGGPATLMMTTTDSGGTGDWGATSLAPSASWGVGGNTGGFSWSYPIKTPSVVGSGPGLSLSYESGASDGRVASSNNQTSVVGEGWSLTESYVERKFVPCADDQDPVDGHAANNADHATGDMCAGADNATLVLNGSAVDLVKKADGTWLPKKIDGTKIERKTGAANGDEEGEYWLVTTSDGTEYTFGRGSRASDGLATGSSWTMPVYGNHFGEPGYTAPADGGFAKSKRDQTYRWMLEHVADPTGGTMTYVYSKETRKYTFNLDQGVARYTAGGHLSRILYGTRASGTGVEGSGPAPVRVDLEYATRCEPGTGVNCDAGRVKQNLAAWPDVPGDLVCYTSATSCGERAISPAFYTLYRLDRIVTRVHDGSAYRPVDSWKLKHSFLDPGDSSLGDGMGKVMWLSSIRHTGHGGTTATSDDLSNNPVVFGRQMLPNRIDRNDDGLFPMYRPRMTGVRTESGAVISPTYTTGCTNDIPASASGNTQLCFPVDWQDEEDPSDWFHKYVVTAVVSNGTSVPSDGTEIVTGSGQVFTRYAYQGGAKWVKPTGPLTDPKEATYSEFRGFRTVVTTTGEGSEASSTTTQYLRGIDGSSFDVGPAGDRKTVTDHDAHQGAVVEVTEHNGTGSADPVSVSVTVPGAPEVVATGVDDVEATVATGVRVFGFTMNAAAAVATRTAGSTTFDQYGQVKLSEDLGDTTTGTDDTCSQTTYAYEADSGLAGKNMLALVKRTQTLQATCANVTGGQVTRPGDVLSDTYATYNSAGRVTETWAIDPDLKRETGTLGNANGTGYERVQALTYDGLGRVLTETDAEGRVSETVYTPATGVLPTQVVTKTPDPDGSGPKAPMASTATFDRVTGLMTAAKDPNGLTIRGNYDGLGRLTSVVKPQHAGLTVPSVKYEYTTRSNGLNVVVTKTLGADADNQPIQHVSAEFYDGLMRVFQTHEQSVDTGESRNDTPSTRGRLVTQTFYDTAGRVSKETGNQHATGAVSATPVQPELVAPSATIYAYDGAGRVVDQIFYTGVEDNPDYERWRTVTRYDAPYTTVVPPDGGTATTTVVDGRGRTTALWEHNARPTVSSDTAAGHWYVPSTLPGFNPRTLETSTYLKTAYTYDRFGSMTKKSDPAGNQWSYEFDMVGRQTKATDPDTGVTTTFYDEAGNLARSVNGTGNASGASQAVKDANTLTYTYDKLDRPLTVADGAGNQRSRWTYDTTDGPDINGDGTPDEMLGLVSSSTRVQDDLEYTTSVDAYDGAYQPTATTVTLPNLPELAGLGEKSFTTSTKYRIDGSVRQTVVPAVTQSGDSDGDGTVESGTVLGAERVTTFYDDAGLPEWMGGGFGWGTYVADSRFAADGRPTAMDVGNTYGAVVTWQYENGTERLTGIQLDRERFDGTDLNLQYGYDDAGNITSIFDQPSLEVGDEYPGGPVVPGNARNDNQCFDYDGLGRMVGAWTDYDATCDTAIDGVTPAEVGTPDNSAAPYWSKYTYDTIGNRRSLTEHVLDGTTNVVHTSYQHGGTNAGPHQVRTMTQQVGPEGTVTSAPSTTVAGFTYDAAGNQTSRALSDPVDTSDPTQVELDADGDGKVETTQTLGWDGEGELATVTTGGEGAQGEDTLEAGDAEYVYSADGDRILRKDPSGATVYLPGGQEVTVTDGVVSAVRYYSFAGQMVAVRDGRGLGGVTSLVCDHQGTTVAAVPNTVWTADSVDRIYSDPFGGDRTPDTTDPATGETVNPAEQLPGDHRFLGGAGGVDDAATGFTLLGARYYDPQLGRFLSVDPLMVTGDPQQWNGYSYSGNSPVTYSDPSGLRETAHDDPRRDTQEQIASAVAHSSGRTSGGASKPSAGELKPVVNIYVGDGNDIPDTGLPAGTFIPVDTYSYLVNLYGDEQPDWLSRVESFTPPCSADTAIWETCDSGLRISGDDIADFAYALFVEDYVDCAHGAVTGCVWVAVGFIPGGKIAKGTETVIHMAKYADEAVDAANTAGDACKAGVCGLPGRKCFVAGTLILTENGEKPIEEIEVGDKVVSKDPATGKEVLQEVDETYVRQTERLVKLTVAGSVLSTTGEHPFWVDGRGWVDAGDLAVGDVLVTPEGTTAVEEIEVETTDGPVTVYNFRVPGLHNYYALAGDTPVLVHNADYSFTPTSQRAGDLGQYTEGQKTRDAFSHYEFMDNDEFLATINGVEEGAGINVSRGGTIMDGHHRWDELQRRVADGRIGADTPIDIWILGGE